QKSGVMTPTLVRIFTGFFSARGASQMGRHDLFQATSFSPERAWADTWHLWTVMIPRRSITGRLLWGRVWRRHDGRRWIYKKFVEFEQDDPI
ncbi:MAG TPA: hypothetical protein VK577_21805, partial [Bradyrhizobium sp.]|nr:hypothetical protein [Bradyrhizobium sp.]